MKRAFALAGLFFATSAWAQESIPWKEIGGWDVLMDPSMGNACFITTVYDEGTILRLGFDFSQEQRSIYLALGNKNWKSLEAGKEYPLQIQFDRNPMWDATATAIDFNGTNFLAVSTTETDFASEFSRKLGMRATFNGREVAALRLNGSSRAVTEMLNCQEKVNEALVARQPPQAPKDPFQATPDVKSAHDPFEL